jgi:hypothetical protein
MISSGSQKAPAPWRRAAAGSASPGPSPIVAFPYLYAEPACISGPTRPDNGGAGRLASAAEWKFSVSPGPRLGSAAHPAAAVSAIYAFRNPVP